MRRSPPALALVPLLLSCQSGSPDTSKTQLASAVTTVPEIARSTTLTIFATENHANPNQCFHTVLNRWVMNHQGVCANHYGHGGRWRMNWKAYCERQVTAACEESYPVLTSQTRTELATWKGVNEHLHGLIDWASCGRWTWDSSWEGANTGDCQSKGEVILNSGTGQEHAHASIGVGYSARHAEDQLTVSPAVFISAEGPGVAAGLEFSYRDQSWGNGFETQCEYKCDWASSTSEVVLMEKCWQVGLEDSDERSTMYTSATGLTYDEAWREIGRSRCTEDDGDGGGDGGEDGSSEEDAGSSPGEDAGDGGVEADASDGGDLFDSGLPEPDPQDASGMDPDGGGDGGPGDGGSGGGSDAAVDHDGGAGDAGPGDGGPAGSDGGACTGAGPLRGICPVES